MAAPRRFALHLAVAAGSTPAIVREANDASGGALRATSAHREEALIANLREADAVARAGLH